MEEGLASLCIDEKEEEVWQIQGKEVVAPINYEFCFVGSFLMTSIVNFQSMQNTLANPWHLIGGVSILDLGDTFFVEDRMVKRIFLSHIDGKKQSKRDTSSSTVSAKANSVGDMIDHVMTGNLNGSIESVK
ncbi:hypothetical protein J1N35_041527 [Gossypium stocksii]|uniref:DUF4283 domain-containing protein n=1 Tax=Gossypium stocksii TaxID=47602 RepID=A0A9D3UFN0_9ROSI|nr:hypothetical protein J1N35_041527 [Gossypium stocksii]